MIKIEEIFGWFKGQIMATFSLLVGGRGGGVNSVLLDFTYSFNLRPNHTCRPKC